MKHVFRFISILLCVCILCAVCIHADDQAGAIHAVSLQGDTATVSVTAPKNCTVAAALYSDDGQMQAIGTAAITGSQTQQSIDTELIGRTDEFDTMKVFLLDLISGMPLCGHLTKTAAELQLGALNLPAIWKEELTLAGELGLPMDKITQKTVSGQEWAELLDWLVAYVDESKLSDWQTCFPALRTHKEALTRFDAMGALYLAAQSLGNGWAEFKSDPHAVMGMLQFPWNDYYFTYELVSGIDGQKFPVPGTDELQYLDGACLNFNFSRPSGFSGEYPFFYDVTANSIHENDLPTYAECLLAIVRFIASEQPELFGTIDPTQPDDQLLTKELIALSNANPSVTAENHPQWNGFVLCWDPDAYYSATPDNIRHIADWGFNSLRVMIDYRNLFDAEDVTIGNPAGLRYLDTLIATAIKNDLHLNLCLCKLPGRCAIVDPDTYTSTGEFDLFINEEQQKKADHIWSVLAARYRDVSNANLSITPFWEALNYNLSTGLPYEEYTPEDVGAYLVRVIDVIRAEDPDRLIIYEPTANNPYDFIIAESTPIKQSVANKGNVLISYNFCENPYVYANMTATEGEHIDNNNHSIPVPEYPTRFYATQKHITGDNPLVLTGCLPAGTTIDLYLAESEEGTFTIRTETETLYTESTPTTTYETGYRMSREYAYATSNKHIRVVLPDDAEQITISTTSSFSWSGMDVTLPEKYAIDQWWYISPYDVFKGYEETDGMVLKHTSRIIISPTEWECSSAITIHDTVSYSTESIRNESNADTIRAWCEAIEAFDGNCIVRIEPTQMVGTIWSNTKQYIQDVTGTLVDFGFSWWSNEFWAMTNEYPQTKVLVGNTTTKYDGFSHFNLELLQLLQSYTKPVDLVK